MTDAKADAKPAPKTYLDRMRAAMQAGQGETALEICDEGLANWRWNETLWAARVNVLVRLGRFPDAIALANDTGPYLRKAQQSTLFHMRAFEAYLEQGDLDGARQRLADMRALDPDAGSYVMVATAKLGMASGDHKGALAELEPRLEDFPHHAQLRGLVARNMVACGRVPEALALVLETYLRKNNTELLVLYAQILLDEGRFDEAAQFLTHYAAQVRESARLTLEQMRVLEHRGEFAQAVTLLDTALTRFPNEIQLHSNYWRMLTLTGQGDKASELAQGFADAAGASVRARLAAARFQFVSGNTEAGTAILRAAALDNPGNPLVMMRAAHSELDHNFNPQAAMAILEATGSAPADSTLYAGVRAKSLRQMGFIPEAIDLLQRARANGDLDHNGEFQLASFLALIGQFDAARTLLDEMQLRTRDARYRKHCILADIAFQQSNLIGARNHILRAIVLRGRDGVRLDVLAKYQIHAGDYVAAWTNHATSIERLYQKQMTGDVTNKPIRSLMGQLLNEYRLFFGERDAFGLRWSDAREMEARQFYRTALQVDPGSTPAALGLLSALRRTGSVTDTPPTATAMGDMIPKTVYQFWDSPELPEQLDEVMTWNREMNPDYTFRRFDLKEAKAYFTEKDEKDAYQAYLLSPHVAGKADIFRLTVLWHEGGVYLDADDRCAAPFSSFLDHRLRFVGYQETYWTVGNNFMAVRRHDPIVRAALEDAVEAFLGPRGASVWLSSGPGAISRALALHGTDATGALDPDVWIMPLHRMYQLVVPHIRLTYKTSDVHWIRQLRKREE